MVNAAQALEQEQPSPLRNVDGVLDMIQEAYAKMTTQSRLMVQERVVHLNNAMNYIAQNARKSRYYCIKNF